MSMPDAPQDDFVDSLLTASVNRDDDGGLRDRIRRQTTAVLRRRRYLRRGGIVALALGFYLAGAATWGLLCRGPRQLAQTPPPEVAEERQVAPLPPSPPIVAETPPDRPKVAAAPKSRYEARRRSADKSLFETGDITAAIRGYTLALRVASPEEQQISADQDSWLLMALKDARSKETSRGKP